MLVKDLGGHLDEAGVGDPRAVVAGEHLARLVVADLFVGGVVGLLVVLTEEKKKKNKTTTKINKRTFLFYLDGDLGSHAAHGVDAALVAGLDQQLDIVGHEGDLPRGKKKDSTASAETWHTVMVTSARSGRTNSL